MKTWTGTARFHDMGPGTWTLETTDGRTMPMFGAIPAELSGHRVVVQGTEAESFGFGPSGDGIGIQVKTITTA